MFYFFVKASSLCACVRVDVYDHPCSLTFAYDGVGWGCLCGYKCIYKKPKVSLMFLKCYPPWFLRQSLTLLGTC